MYYRLQKKVFVGYSYGQGVVHYEPARSVVSLADIKVYFDFELPVTASVVTKGTMWGWRYYHEKDGIPSTGWYVATTKKEARLKIKQFSERHGKALLEISNKKQIDKA